MRIFFCLTASLVLSLSNCGRFEKIRASKKQNLQPVTATTEESPRASTPGTQPKPQAAEPELKVPRPDKPKAAANPFSTPVRPDRKDKKAAKADGDGNDYDVTIFIVRSPKKIPNRSKTVDTAAKASTIFIAGSLNIPAGPTSTGPDISELKADADIDSAARRLNFDDETPMSYVEIFTELSNSKMMDLEGHELTSVANMATDIVSAIDIEVFAADMCIINQLKGLKQGYKIIDDAVFNETKTSCNKKHKYHQGATPFKAHLIDKRPGDLRNIEQQIKMADFNVETLYIIGELMTEIHAAVTGSQEAYSLIDRADACLSEIERCGASIVQVAKFLCGVVKAIKIEATTNLDEIIL